MINKLSQHLSQLLIEPHSSISDPVERRLILLLSTYNLITIPTGPIIGVIRPTLPEHLWVAILGICTLFYLLSRSAFASSAVKFQILTSVGIPLMFAAIVPDSVSVHFSFLLPVLLSMLLYSLRVLVICSITSLSGFLIITHLFPITDSSQRSGSFLMLSIIVSTIIITRYHLQWLEQEREIRKEQSRKKFLALVHSTFDGIATVEQNVFTHVSDGFAAVFSDVTANITGRCVAEFLESTLKVSERLDGELGLFSALNSKGEMRFIQMIEERVDPVESIIAVRDVTVEQDANLNRLLMERITSTGMIASSVAHEMNTPLMIAQSQIERSMDELTAQPQKVAERLASATNALNQMESILGDLRWFVNSGAVTHTADPENVIQNAIRLAHHRIQHRTTITTALTDLPPLAISESKLSQVIINLVFNAAKAGQPNQDTVGISISGSVIGDDVELVIKDDGIGIPNHLQQRIFAPFYTTNKSEGTGLGLSLCQSIIHNAQGRIDLDSELGVGTKFTLRIPQHHIAPTKTQPAAYRPRLVVIDSHPQVLEMIGEFLTDYDVALCLNVDEGIASLREALCAMIICDARLPEGGTDRLIRFLQDFEQGRSVKLGLMTRSDQQEMSLTNEALEYTSLEKPFTEQQFEAFVKQSI
jgi:signal transduction histidine kinase